MKRIISLFLVVLQLVTMIPVPVQAQDDSAASIDVGDVSLEGVNAVGTLLGESIAEHDVEIVDPEDPYGAGYSITDLEIRGNTAVVTCESMEDATIVVALYTEDGLQLLNSASAGIFPGDIQVTVSFSGQMPDYFMASAYMLDAFDLSPLCPAYDTPMYTEEMQDLLASTVEDYAPERVLNLDERSDTNFMVYAEETVRFSSTAECNTVAQADTDNESYVIEHADDTVKNLAPGDVFVCEYSETDMLIVKVSQIQTDGDTVTITGADVELEEVFSHIKLEAEGNSDNATVGEEGMDSGVTYLGTEESSGTYGARSSQDGDITVDKSLKYACNFYEEGKLKIDGEVAVAISASIQYYLSPTYQRVEVRITPSASAKFVIEATIGGPTNFGLGSIMIPIGAFFFIDITPSVSLEISASVEFEAKLSSMIGFYLESGFGGMKIKPLITLPKLDIDAKLEGKIKLGIGLDAGIKLLDGYLLSMNLVNTLFTEWSAKTTDAQKGVKHECSYCLDGDKSVGADGKASISSLGGKKKWEKTFFSIKAKVGDFHICPEHGGYQDGECPYYSYQLTAEALDYDNVGYPDALISAGGKTEKTGEHGIVEMYLPKAEYVVSCTFGQETLRRRLYLDNPQKVIFRQGDEDMPDTLLNTVGKIPAAGMVDVSDAGSTGKFNSSNSEESDVRWALYENGTLRIYGSGSMPNFGSGSDNKAPWFYEDTPVRAVIVYSGITRIGSNAFNGCEQLTRVSLPASLRNIGSYAFSGCTELDEISIPNKVRVIESGAFFNCSSLTDLSLPSQLESLGSSAFSRCTGLTELEVSDTVTTWGYGAFGDCTGLKTVTVPVDYMVTSKPFDGCTNVERIVYTPGSTGIMKNRTGSTYNVTENDVRYTMEHDSKAVLRSVEFTEGVISIGNLAFYECAQLTEVKLPSTLEKIGDSAFYGCTALPAVELGNKLTTIGGAAFYECSALKEILLPSSLTTLGASCFKNCTGLQTLTIPESVTSIPGSAFENCTGLESLLIPDTVTTWGNYAFKNCTGLRTVTLPVDYDVVKRPFIDCTGVERIVYTPGSTGVMKNRTNSTYNITEDHVGYTMENDSKAVLQSVEFREGVKAIGNLAFYECAQLSDVKLPSTLERIGDSAFYGCTALPTVELGNKLTTIGGAAFYGCSALNYLLLPSSLTTLGASCFKNCTGLQALTIPESVTSIPGNAFENCTGLESLLIPDTVTTWGNYAFKNCTGLKTVTLPVDYDVVKRPFIDCTGVERIVYTPGSTGVMKNRTNSSYNITEDHVGYTMENDSKAVLQSVEFREGVKAIGNLAFYECAQLSDVKLPSTLERIGSNAFYRNTSLTELQFIGNAPGIASNSFYGVTATVSYPGANQSWNEAVFQNYGGNLTWVNSDAEEMTDELLNGGIIPVETEPEETEPEETEPEETEPEETEPEETEPEETEPEETEPEETEPEETEPADTQPEQTYFEEANVTQIVYEGVSDDTSGEDTQTIALEETVPEEENTEAPIPEETQTEETHPEETISEETYPEETVFEEEMTAENVNEAPSDEISEEACVMTIVEETVIPEEETTEISVPEENEPQNHNPEEWIPEDTGPDETDPEETEPEPPATEEYIPEETEPEYTETETTVPQETLPEEPIPETTLPEMIGTENFEIAETQPTLDAVYSGEYSSEKSEQHILRKANFSGLVEGEQYVLLALQSMDTGSPLAGENILYIDQGEADEGGTLVFEYVQRRDTEFAYVIACGASHKNLNDGLVIFPEMIADGMTQAASPTVTYGGKTLKEGTDYILLGTVSYSTPGEYTCYVRGIYDYAGLVKCTYSVRAPKLVTQIELDQASLLLKPGEMVKLTANVLPEDADETGIAWSSSAESIASVDAQGQVTANSDGTAVITAASLDGSGVTASCEVTVSSKVPLNILTQPSDYVGALNSEAAFAVVVNKEDVQYQWYYSSDNGESWYTSGSAGAQTDTLTVQIKTHRMGQLYRCQITDSDGNVVITNAVTMLLPPSTIEIISQPADATGSPEEQMTFRVEAEGEGLSYLWYYSNDGISWAQSWSEGYNASEFRPLLRAYCSGRQFKCLITDANGNMEWTEAVTMKLASSEIVILSQPESRQGVLDEKYEFTVAAEGINLEYRWYFSSDGGNSWQLSYNDGYNTPTLVVRLYAYRDGYQYRCEITSGSDKAITTEAAVLTLRPATAKILNQPMDAGGEAGVMVSFQVKATGTGLKYQWQYKGVNNDAWYDSGMAGATTDTLQVMVTASRDGQKYRCRITDDSGRSITSTEVTLRMGAAAVITAQPENQSGTSGEQAVFTVTATGENLQYQWQYSNNDGVSWDNSSATGNQTPSLTVAMAPHRNGQQYRCVITNEYGSVISKAAVLTVS